VAKRLPLGEGNGHSKGLIDIVALREGCSLFVQNPQEHQPPDELPMRMPKSSGSDWTGCRSRSSTRYHHQGRQHRGSLRLVGANRATTGYRAGSLGFTVTMMGSSSDGVASNVRLATQAARRSTGRGTASYVMFGT
jgi:hypothetical protein